MHIAICIIIIFFVWRRGVWREWREYHSTMLFFGWMQLHYILIVGTNDYYLWKLIPDVILSRVIMISLYGLIIFPGTVLLFLSKCKGGIKDQAVQIVKLVAIYMVFEWIGSVTNRIVYLNGWNIWYSLIFDVMLFTGLLLHHKRPLTAYVVYIIVTVLGIWVFRIPI